MRVFPYAMSRRLTFILLLSAGLYSPGLYAYAQVDDATDIVRRSVDRDWTDFTARTNYTYQQEIVERQRNRDGKIAHSDSQTHEIMILGGRPYERLVAKDGKPLSAQDARKEQAKLDRESAKRQHESGAERTRMERERAEDRRFIREIPEAFNFRMLGTEAVSGQPAWVIEAEPKPGFRPKRSQAKMFQKIRAKIWIEQATYHWVKMDANVLETLSFGFGLLRVAPGATLHFEQVHVNGEIWLPSTIHVQADARLALVKTTRAEVDVRFSEYKKFQSESRIEGVAETQ